MSATYDFPRTGCSVFPAFAADLVTYRQRVHPEWPNLPRWFVTVSRADVEAVRAAGKTQVPTRNKHGERLSEIHARLTRRAADAYAKRHGWPFTVHLSNLDNADEV